MVDTVVIIFNFSPKMNKIFDGLDYIFYRLYKFFHPLHLANSDEQLSISTIGLMLMIPMATIAGTICHYYGLRFEKYSLQSFTIVAILFFLTYVPLVQRYVYDKSISEDKYKVFRDRWGKEGRKLRKKRGWFIVLLVINNILVFPVLFLMLTN